MTFWTGVGVGVAGCAVVALAALAFMEFFAKRANGMSDTMHEALREKAGDGSTNFLVEVRQSDLATVLREGDDLLASNDRLHDAMTEARQILQPGDGTIVCDRDSVVRAVIVMRTAAGEMP